MKRTIEPNHKLEPGLSLAIVFVVSLFSCAALFAQQGKEITYIMLKTGSTLVGWIESQTADSLFLNTKHGAYRLAKSDCESIETEGATRGTRIVSTPTETEKRNAPPHPQQVDSKPIQPTSTLVYRFSLKDKRVITGRVASETDDDIRILAESGATYQYPKSFIISQDLLGEFRSESAAIRPTSTSESAKEARKSMATDSLATLHLKDNTMLIGTILSWESDSARVKTAYGAVVVPRSSILRIEMNQSLPHAPSPSVKAVSVADWLNRRAIVHLKGGGIAYGTLTRTLPGDRFALLTVKFGTVVYDIADVESIASEGTEPTGTVSRAQAYSVRGSDYDYNPSRGYGVRRTSVLLFGGASIPMGDLAETSGQKAGYAQTGFDAGIQWYGGSENVQFTIAGVFASNSTDMSTVFSPSSSYSANVESGSWMTIWTLGGGRFAADVAPSFQIHGDVLFGALIGMSPEIKATLSAYNYYTGRTETVTATQESQTAVGFAYGVGFGFSISQFDVTIRYLGGSPEYEIEAKGSSGTTSSSKFQQPTGLLFLTAGVNL
ncbi:MAG: hypothetical protein HY961_03255 [Ignavibacteriae bacterium]|nr:hypothetical protein [Ignavibacteriota bacterium]